MSTNLKAVEHPLWYTRCPLPTASGIALDNGLLENALADIGQKALSIEQSDDPSAMHSHFTHKLPQLFRQGGNIPPIWARSQGTDTALVGIAWTPEYQAILALPGSGIRSAADLKGRRLGLPVRSGGEIDFWQAMCLRGFQSALRTVGFELTDAELVRLPVHERYIDPLSTEREANTWMWSGAARMRRQQAELFALMRNEVDAIYVSGAQGSQLAAMLSAHVVTDLGFHTDPEVQINNQVPNVLTVDGALCRQRPDVVARYLFALQSAARWASEHPFDSRRTFASEVGAPEEWIANAYGPSMGTDRLVLSLEPRWLNAIDAQKKFLLEQRFITQDFELAQWVNSEPLEMCKAIAEGVTP
ncbi:ABC transporter substrate-binding protein [Ottowia thiooxydans]|uniref:ABC-type nitrate/sulfonate/bicarbonate transport system substrate-binding protein n=1 Tax=Ottowia thiooxydans TaxID=219182 RepID=A0ABV2Q9Q2_9BURK